MLLIRAQPGVLYQFIRPTTVHPSKKVTFLTYC